MSEIEALSRLKDEFEAKLLALKGVVGEIEKRGLQILTPDQEKAIKEAYQYRKRILDLEHQIEKLQDALEKMRSQLPLHEREYRLIATKFS